ncbi:MAG: NAD(P)-dependent oxidoreductase [Acidiferrobacterales bacterium]
MDKDQTIGFIGLGQMGKPMAANLLSAGYCLRAYNRSAGRVQELGAAGVTPAAKPVEAVASGGIVVTMIANDQALEEVVQGMGGFGEALGEGGVHLSMSTVAPATARRLAAYHADRGSAYVAAPVFGRTEAAAARKLWICVAGAPAARSRVQPLLEVLGQQVYDFGDNPASANVVKLAGNFLIVTALEAMAESFALAAKNGVDPARFATVMSETLFGGPIYQNYGRLIASGIYEPAGFKLSLGKKDIDLVQQTANESRVPMPLASLLHDRLLSGLARNRGDLDWTALALGVREDAGLSGGS